MLARNVSLVFLGVLLASSGCDCNDNRAPSVKLRAVDVFEAKAKLLAVRDADAETLDYEVHVVLRNRHTERVVAVMGYDPRPGESRIPGLAPGVGFVLVENDGTTSSLTSSRSLGENWAGYNELAPGETKEWRFVFGVNKDSKKDIGDMSRVRVVLSFFDVPWGGTVVGDLLVPVSVEKVVAPPAPKLGPGK